MAENGNGDSVKFKWPTVIAAFFIVISIFVGFLFRETTSANTAIAQLRTEKLDKTEFKECKIDLTVNQSKMEERIMARLDKLDQTIESQSRERLEALKEQLRKRVP